MWAIGTPRCHCLVCTRRTEGTYRSDLRADGSKRIGQLHSSALRHHLTNADNAPGHDKAGQVREREKGETDQGQNRRVRARAVVSSGLNQIRKYAICTLPAEEGVFPSLALHPSHPACSTTCSSAVSHCVQRNRQHPSGSPHTLLRSSTALPTLFSFRCLARQPRALSCALTWQRPSLAQWHLPVHRRARC